MIITGWGRYPRLDAEAVSFDTPAALSAELQKGGEGIAHAMGRSYGDSALGRRVFLTRRYHHILAFDAENGVVTCESGVSLADLIDAFLPRGWFLSVTPGTKLITVGGAIASDVHGKNHHAAGCFSNSVLEFDLMLADGSIVKCSPEENQELFLATCGGMGLTGVILQARLQLQRVKSANIRETVIRCRDLEAIFEAFEAYESTPYSVAWIDCLAKGAHTGRSVLMAGAHAETGTRRLPARNQLSVPVDMPGFGLNRHSVGIFNRVYYSAQPDYVENRLVPLEPFFYPLDQIANWNRMYGRKGFTQYQLVLPKTESFTGLRKVLNAIAAAGMGSFLAVLKLCGPENGNFISFPMEGYSLALDFKIEPRLFPFLETLDRIVLDHGGRLYLTKDVRMSKTVFREGYPRWKKFVALRESYGMKEKFKSLQSERIGV